MAEITLKEFLKDHEQKEVLAVLGCTQGNVSQMLASGRDIRLILNAKGKPTSYYEIKKSRKRRAA